MCGQLLVTWGWCAGTCGVVCDAATVGAWTVVWSVPPKKLKTPKSTAHENETMRNVCFEGTTHHGAPNGIGWHAWRATPVQNASFCQTKRRDM